MTQTLAAALLWCSLNRRYSRDVISVEFVLHFLHVSTAVIMLFLSVYSSKGNMLSTRSPLSLSLSLHCLPLSLPLLHCPWPEGTVGFLNALPPFVSTHWLALRSPQKQSSMGCRQPAFCWCCSKSLREEEKTKNEGLEIIRRLHHSLSRYVCSLCLPLLL